MSPSRSGQVERVALSEVPGVASGGAGRENVVLPRSSCGSESNGGATAHGNPPRRQRSRKRIACTIYHLLIFACMKLEDMQAAAERVSELMKLLGNQHRLLVLCKLAEGETSVGELARLLGAREPAMSQQLAVLRREGLVRRRRDAQTIYYALAREDVRRLMEFLHASYCGDAAARDEAREGEEVRGREEANEDVVPDPAER